MISIDGRKIGAGQPPYVIAEMSGNHNGDIERALMLMDVAKGAGVDAIKLQTYTADIMTLKCDKPEFKIEGGLWDGHTLHDLYEWAHTPWDWHETLFAKGRELGVTVFSSPFDVTSLALLETLNCPAYKIASFEVVDLDLIEHVAATGKPLIISTGMANLQEIEEALEVVQRTGNDQVALLHCVSGYPTDPAESNLATIADMAVRFGKVTGLSDHTMGVTVPAAGIALGASIVEKHFTLARADGGPDAAFSLEPNELKDLVKTCRTSWAAIGSVGYERKPAEESNAIFRRSLYVVADVQEGEMFTSENVRSIRPGYGLKPKHLKSIMGKVAAQDVERGSALCWDMVQDGRLALDVDEVR